MKCIVYYIEYYPNINFKLNYSDQISKILDWVSYWSYILSAQFLNPSTIWVYISYAIKKSECCKRVSHEKKCVLWNFCNTSNWNYHLCVHGIKDSKWLYIRHILTHKHIQFPAGNICVCHHCYKKRPGARSAPSHSLNRCWLIMD